MYVDAMYSRDDNEIRIVERINSNRVYKTYPAKYTLYYDDTNGKYKTIFGNKVSKFTTSNIRNFQKELRILEGKNIYEHDINPIFRCLEENYINCELPKLHIAFFDIEVDYDPNRGFAPVEDAFSPITSVSLYLNWIGKLITLVCSPPEITEEEASKITESFENCFLCKDEKELLKLFLEFIEDADVISGWNSTGFDIPYIVHRIIQSLGKDYTRNLCLWDQHPKKKMYTQYKAEKLTYELIGRVHLDYLDLYRKHTYSERLSYRLDFIGEVEVNEKKIPYEGTLDSLYRKDFYKFIEYNRQDVMILVKLDNKLKFIELSNQLAHDNTVLLKTTLGSVALIEQSIINEAHRRDMITPSRKKEEIEENSIDSELDEDEEDEENKGAAGAYVADPKVGLHDYIGGVDINSLYPSTIRCLNMSPETVVGQLRQDYTIAFLKEKMDKMKKPSLTKAWEGVFSSLEYDFVIKQNLEKEISFDLETGETIVLTGKDLHNFIFNENSNFCLSANGTVFRTDIEGVIPGLLTRWFFERKDMQKTAKKFAELSETETDPDKKEEYEKQYVFWDQRQLVRKILLNSLYGALLNESCKFYDSRIGQSVTLTGRSIAKHMGSEINRLIYGVYDHVGESSIYQDTDSSYFTSYQKDLSEGALNDIKDIKSYYIEKYDEIGKNVNESFPGFMQEKFHVPLENGKVIRAARELVATKGLFITKKRYAVLIYDKEGKRKDKDNKPGEIKAMGLDTKRSDTPPVIQNFLEEVILMVLTDHTEKDVLEYIKRFREDFRKWHGWEKGTPKKVNALTKFNQAVENRKLTMLDLKKRKIDDKKVNLPGHVRAALNWNILKNIYNDNYSMPISDGTKVLVCKLRDNPMNMTSVALPVDESHIPEWFRNLPFDHDEMEKTIIDKKIQNLIGVLGWNLKSTKEDTTFNKLFDF